MRLMLTIVSSISYYCKSDNIVFLLYVELILEIKTERAATRSESTDRKGKKLSARQQERADRHSQQAARLN